MKNDTWMNQCNFPPGTVIRGKWHHHRYQVVRKLGQGANGVVYFVKGDEGTGALKMSTDSLSIISEVNVLKAFEKVQGFSLGPSLLDVDDWKTAGGKDISFYVMEYIQGPDLLTYIQQKGASWVGVMAVQLLDILKVMHEKGWVFGDLKPENIIISGPPARIRCIDVGGTTKQGRAIKEFTEFFDRGYWGLGSRKAEPSYDLFSTAMLIINTAYPEQFSKKGDGREQLFAAIQGKPELQMLDHVLHKALTGKYVSAAHMKTELVETLSMGRRMRKIRQKNKGQDRPILETATVVTGTLALYGAYIYFFLL